MAPNRLAFSRIVERSGHGKETKIVEIAVPMVDGVPLFSRLDDRYAGLAMDFVAGTRHLCGQPRYGEDGRTVLLDGSCGIAECCGVMAIIEVFEDRVIWRDLFARGRPELPEGLRFEFARDQYEAAVAELPAVPELDEETWPLE